MRRLVLLLALVAACSAPERAPAPPPPVAAASELTLELPWALLVAAAQALGVSTDGWPEGAPAVLRLSATANPPAAPAPAEPEEGGFPWLEVLLGLPWVLAAAAAGVLIDRRRRERAAKRTAPDLPPGARARADRDSPRTQAVPGQPGGRTSPEPEIDP